MYLFHAFKSIILSRFGRLIWRYFNSLSGRISIWSLFICFTICFPILIIRFDWNEPWFHLPSCFCFTSDCFMHNKIESEARKIKIKVKIIIKNVEGQGKTRAVARSLWLSVYVYMNVNNKWMVESSEKKIKQQPRSGIAI